MEWRDGKLNSEHEKLELLLFFTVATILLQTLLQHSLVLLALSPASTNCKLKKDNEILLVPTGTTRTTTSSSILLRTSTCCFAWLYC